MFLNILLAVTILAAQGQVPGIPSVSSLTGNCAISVQVLGPFVPIGETEGLWLSCGEQRFRIVHPDNLLDHVKIASAAQALEFVRLFTARSTFNLLHTGGCVEITNAPDDPLFYGVKPALFSKHFKPASVEAQPSKRAGDSGFVVTRVVVCPNQSVYELTEAVYEDGMYFQMSKTLVLRKASVVGITHYVH